MRTPMQDLIYNFGLEDIVPKEYLEKYLKKEQERYDEAYQAGIYEGKRQDAILYQEVEGNMHKFYNNRQSDQH